MQILINGKETTTFKLTRGIQLGDPLYPYLFVLCIERLSHLIHMEVYIHNWKHVPLFRVGLRSCILSLQTICCSLMRLLVINELFPQISHPFLGMDIMLEVREIK